MAVRAAFLVVITAVVIRKPLPEEGRLPIRALYFESVDAKFAARRAQLVLQSPLVISMDLARGAQAAQVRADDGGRVELVCVLSREIE